MWWSFIFNLGISTVILVAKADYKRFRLKDNPVESIQCKPTSTILINNVYVEDGKCNNSSCVLEDNDHALIYSRCNDTTSCLLDLNLTSPCLLGKRNFDLFYGCKDIAKLFKGSDANRICPRHLQFSNCTVIDLEPESYACNFEQDFCKWLPGNWTRRNHAAGSGYHIGIDGFGGNIERHAELSTGVIVSNGSKCISFLYNMESSSGVPVSKLELLQTKEQGKSSLLKEYINSTEAKWIRETLDLPGSLPYRIIFRGTVFGHWENHIGLDDIDILPESCSGGNISEENMPGKYISENRLFQEHCLDFDDNFTIDGCQFLDLDTSKLQLVFEPAVETSNMECQGIENKTKNNLFSRCEEGAFSGCDVNQYAIISFDMAKEQECIKYNKDIVLEYSCTELPSINEYSTVPYNKEETMDMTGVAVAIVACVGLIIACLIITGIFVFKRKAEKQRTLNIDKTNSKTGFMNINKTKEVQSTSQRDVSMVVHEYIDIDLSKETCSDQTKHKEDIFEYELAKPLTSDTSGAFRYDLAKPLSTVVKDGRSTDFSEFNSPKDCSEYVTTKMNDSTKHNGYNERENIVVYSRTFDGVYDVASSGQRNVTSDNTYEHCAFQDKQ